MTPVTTTTNTKTVYRKALFGVMKTRTFIVLATLLLIDGVMIGQVLARPTAAQTGAAEDCTKIPQSDEPRLTACWLKKAKAGDKNLRNSWLNGVDLSKAKLVEADMSGARLVKADLTRADLRHADMREADMRMTILNQANLAQADLIGANLTGAWMPGAYMIGTDLRKADLTNADLHNADLRGANLTDAKLTGAKLTGIKKDKNTKGL